MNWFQNDSASWGKDDIIDLIAEHDPDWEEHDYYDRVKKEWITVYFWAKIKDVSIYVYSDCAAVLWENPGFPQWFEDPIEAVFAARNGKCESEESAVD